MAVFVPRWSAKISGTRFGPTDKTDTKDSVGSVSSLVARFQRIVAADAVLAAQRLLHDCKFSPEAAPCSFHCGKPSEACKRCGASWHEHFPAV
jgi:hypothetical protein